MSEPTSSSHDASVPVPGWSVPVVESESAAAPPQTLRQEIRSVGRHSLIYLLGPAFSQLVGFLLIPIYTHLIAPSEYGVMSLVDVLMTLTMMVLAMGLGDSMTRFYYELTETRQRQRLVSTVVFGAGALSLPLVLIVVTLAHPLVRLLGVGPDYVAYLRIGLMTAWFSMLAEIGYTYLRMRYLAKAFVCLTVVQILAAVALNLLFVVVCRWNIWGILYSTLITQALIGLALTGLMVLQSPVRPGIEYLKPLLAFGLPLVPSTVTLQLSNYLNPLLIRWLLAGDPLTVLGQVGIFAMGQKIGVIVNRFVTVPFHAFWRPRRMELVVADNPRVRHILARMCTYATVITVQIALLLSVSAESLLKLLLDRRYWEAHRIVPLVAAAYVVLSLEHHFATGMHFARKTTASIWIGVVSLVAMIGVDLVWIPRGGIVAAAAATLVGVTLRSFLFLVVSQRMYSIPFELRRLATLAIAALILFLAGMQLELTSTWATLMVRLSLGALLLPLLGILRFFTDAEMSFLRHDLPRWVAQGRHAVSNSTAELKR